VSDPCRPGDDAWEQGAWIWSALLYGVLGVDDRTAVVSAMERGIIALSRRKA
jgi:hypothetical protein